MAMSDSVSRRPTGPILYIPTLLENFWKSAALPTFLLTTRQLALAALRLQDLQCNLAVAELAACLCWPEPKQERPWTAAALERPRHAERNEQKA